MIDSVFLIKIKKKLEIILLRIIEMIMQLYLYSECGYYNRLIDQVAL